MSLTRDLKCMSIAEILGKYPEVESVLRQYGLQTYAQTQTAQLENLEASALVHSIDIESLVAALAKTIEG